MPWRDDYFDAYVIHPAPGLAGYPRRKERTPPKPRPEPTALALLTAPDGDAVLRSGRVEEHTTIWDWRPIGELKPAWAVVELRDRLGSRYQRVVGLRDFISQREAAKLLRVPVMTVNRWVRSGKLRSSRRKGLSVIRFKEVVTFAKTHDMPLRTGHRLAIVGRSVAPSHRTKKDQAAPQGEGEDVQAHEGSVGGGERGSPLQAGGGG